MERFYFTHIFYQLLTNKTIMVIFGSNIGKNTEFIGNTCNKINSSTNIS